MHQIAQNMLIARRTERSVKIVAIVIATIGIVVALWMKPNVVSFWEFTKEDIVRLFTQLIVIALFIERSLEVLLTPWRDVEAEKMREQVKDAQQGAQAAQAGPAEAVLEAKEQLVEYKGQTRQLAFLVGLALGMLTSAVGVRGLRFLVEPQAFSKLSGGQTAVFNALDVLLTGALLAGGADGLHKLVSVFTNYMDKTNEKMKGTA